MGRLYYVNGKFVPSDQAQVPFDDVGFLYGDGLFETMRFDDKIIFSYKKHIERLQKGLKIINLKTQFNNSEILNLLNKVINKNNLQSGIIRLMITRGVSNNPSLYVNIKPFHYIPTKPVKVIYLDEQKYPIIRFTPAIKSMNYIGNMLAKRDCEKKQGYEPIFYNKDKIITECAIRNIFFVKNKILYTPSLDLGILPGVMRDTIIDITKKLGYKVIETHIDYSDINNMDEAFISSTGIGLLSCFWDSWLSSYKITKVIKKELFKRIKKH